MNTILLAFVSPLLAILSWICLRLLYCVYNYQVYKRKLRHLPAINDPFARLKSFVRDPSELLWKENAELAGKGNAYFPVVLIGPYMDMGRPLVMVNSPELIREVSNDAVFPKLCAFYDPLQTVLGHSLVSAEGPAWKRMRSVMNPLFYHAKIKLFAKRMTANADELISILRNTNGFEVECGEVLSEATLGVLIDCIFSRNDFNPKWTASHLQKNAKIMMFFTLTEFLFGPTLNSFLPWARVLNSTRKIINSKVAGICQRARNSPTGESVNVVEMLALTKENGKPVFTDAEIAEHAMTLLLAGYDTTKSAISWTLYFLSQHRDELEKVQNEVDSVLKGRTATEEDLPNLVKVKNAITEALRLRLATPGLDRTTPEDTELGGYFIPKGTSIYLNWHAAHTDPTIWENPEAYYPDRYDNNDGYAKNFFAFSYGPRVCIGQKFGIYEAIILTASILQQFDIQKGSGKVQPIIKVSQEPTGFKIKFISRR